MILVTGSTGFIGRELIRQLVSKIGNEKILCLVYNKCDNELEKSGRKNLDELKVKYIEVDLVSGVGLDKVPKSPDMVLHLASVTITAQRDHSINDIGTKNLISAIKPIKPGMHFVFTSTICVNDERDNFNEPITELTPVPKRPSNEYGRKKLLAEKYLTEYAQEFNFSLSVIRVVGVYGNGVRVNGLFDNIEKLVLKKSFLSRMNWPGKISIINVRDMASYIINVSEHPSNTNFKELYLPSVEEYTMAEMCEQMCDVYNMEYKPIKLPRIFWNICRWFARKKGIVEYILPHKIYDTFWQACILVNNEFWNKSQKIQTIAPNWKPLKYKEYYLNKKNNNA